ncbi:hypothetical protein ABEW24_02895 [Paenibacillus jamilae]|uniref:hypothetical protein n=1 Tax=Paenibacillus TaxID=44249 RepID=UPI00077C92B9|nr:hypothetical protein [Paenibacillus polymyxa]KYG92621.1 hypothetical protein AZE31_01795 [Paenibacillus polymyxa]
MSKYNGRKMIFTTYYNGRPVFEIREILLLEAMDKRQISVFENMLNDILGASAKQQVSFG